LLIFYILFNLKFVLEYEDALPYDLEKPFHFPNHLLSPKREDVPLLNLPSISEPCKFEYDTQKLQPKCSNNEGIYETLRIGASRPFLPLFR
jgi:hypothetical protein